MPLHRLYGLVLEADEVIPGVPVCEADTAVDVRVRLKSQASTQSIPRSLPSSFYVSPARDENGIPALQAAFLENGNYLALLYCDGTLFVLDRGGNQVVADWPAPLTWEDATPYLVGPVMGVILRLRGVVPLHASSVAVSDRAIALAGPAGAGKSTLAGAFARCGYRAISDDVVALRQNASRFAVPPGYPRINLWDESARALAGGNNSLPLISPGWDKRFLPLEVRTQFETRSLPLGAIYVLQIRERELAHVTIEQLSGVEAMIAVLGNTYMNHLPDAESQRSEFELLGRVVTQVPVLRVRAAASLSSLSVLCEAIAENAKALLA